MRGPGMQGGLDPGGAGWDDTAMTQQVRIDYSKLRPVGKVPRFSMLRTVSALILREMTATYGRKPGGYMWAILEPAGGIAVITLVFTLFLRTPPLGTNFALFYATGLLPFLMFTNINTKMATALSYSRQLLAYPRVTIIDALLARLILNVMTQLMVSIVILGGILMIFETGTTFVMGDIVLAYALAILLAAGWGTLNCFMASAIPAWQSIWGIFTRPLMILSGVIYIYELIPAPFDDWLWYNPLIHIVGLMRSAFYLKYHADYVSAGYVILVSLVPGVIGLLFLRRYHRELRR
jgi:capsular polysaccharide transport system permease protein